jgi:hypothetical protein
MFGQTLRLFACDLAKRCSRQARASWWLGKNAGAHTKDDLAARLLELTRSLGNFFALFLRLSGGHVHTLDERVLRRE